MGLQFRCGPGLQGLGWKDLCLHGSLTRLACWDWLWVEGLGYSPCWSPHRDAVCPHAMWAAFSHSEHSRWAGWRLQCLLCPNLGSHTGSFQQYPISYSSVLFNVGEVYFRAWKPRNMGYWGEGRFGGYNHIINTNFWMKGWLKKWEIYEHLRKILSR